MPCLRFCGCAQVTFDIDANGIVHVSAKDKATSELTRCCVSWTMHGAELVVPSATEPQVMAKRTRPPQKLILAN